MNWKSVMLDAGRSELSAQQARFGRSAGQRGWPRLGVFPNLPAVLGIGGALGCLVLTGLGCRCQSASTGSSQSAPAASNSTVEKAVAFLQEEVPAWSRENGCYSCHNNGDAARALYLASRRGYAVPASVLADTTAWLRRPETWDDNKGDPGFSDQRLARIQFATALGLALETGWTDATNALRVAASSIAREQDPEGSWAIGPGDTLGAPATYGTLLATVMAGRALAASGLEALTDARVKAESWIRSHRARSVMDGAVLLMFWEDRTGAEAEASRRFCLDWIRRGQTSDGGWGPYPGAPAEVFDSAIVLLGLNALPADLKAAEDIGGMIKIGRAFLVMMQNADGSWPETTRPSGGRSYAQRMSTTGWATLALLMTARR